MLLQYVSPLASIGGTMLLQYVSPLASTGGTMLLQYVEIDCSTSFGHNPTCGTLT